MFEVEKALISCIWADGKNEVVDLGEIDEDMFDGSNIPLLRKVSNFRHEGYPCDIVISRDKLGVETTKQMLSLFGESGGLTSYRHYLDILKKRRVVKTLQEITTPEDIDKGNILKQLESIGREMRDVNKLYNLDRDLVDYIEDVEKRKSGDYERYWIDIDHIGTTLGYLLPGALITIGGLPGIGKTNFALKMFGNAINKGINSLFLSSEMGYFSLIDRLVSINSDMNAYKIRNGKLEDGEIKELVGVVNGKISHKPGWIYEISRFSLESIKKKIDDTQAKFIFIDFLQMFRLDTIKAETRASVMAEIVTSLKEMAMEKGVVIFALSQVNKEGELKESRGIEEKSDIVIKMKIKKVKEVEIDDHETKVVNITISKNRYGLTGTHEFAFDKHNCNFEAMEREMPV